MAKAAESKIVTVIFVGPSGHESPTWGTLEPGERYQMTEDMAVYLTRQHPEFWQRPAVKPAPAVEA